MADLHLQIYSAALTHRVPWAMTWCACRVSAGGDHACDVDSVCGVSVDGDNR
jgi:hypothetical protein